MKNKKLLSTLEIQEEIEKIVSDDFAKKHATNLRFELVIKLRKMGKLARFVLMKNNLIGCVIQSPLLHFFEKGCITQEMFAAGLQYSRDYFISAQDNMARQSYDGTGLNAKNFRKPNKEPSAKQIEAHRRIELIKRELNRKSQYPIPKQKIINRRYVQVVEFFLEQEKPISFLEERLQIGFPKAKARIIEVLEILAETYPKIL